MIRNKKEQHVGQSQRRINCSGYVLLFYVCVYILARALKGPELSWKVQELGVIPELFWKVQELIPEKSTLEQWLKMAFQDQSSGIFEKSW